MEVNYDEDYHLKNINHILEVNGSLLRIKKEKYSEDYCHNFAFILLNDKYIENYCIYPNEEIMMNIREYFLKEGIKHIVFNNTGNIFFYIEPEKALKILPKKGNKKNG